MKNIKKIIICLTLVLLLTACKSSSTYELSLNGSSNSYYNWSYSIEDGTILKVSNEEYYGNEANDDEDNIGLGGVYNFEIQALKKGTTKIEFSYLQTWEDDTVLFSYIIEFEVDKNLDISKVSESGNYLALEKIIAVDYNDLGLDEEISEYKLSFEEEMVTISSDECYYLVVRDYNDELVANYAISINSDNIYKNDDGNLVLLETN